MKKLLCLLLCVSLVLLNGCNKKAATIKASMVEDGKLMYRVIRPNTIKKEQLEVYTDFYTELKKSVKIDSETDSGEKFEREVLLGNTKREESKEALKKLNAKKKDNSDYIIAVINGKIAVTSNDEEGLALAFARFLNDYVKTNKIPDDKFEKVYFAADEKEPDAAIVGEQQNLDGYKLVWSDEFDGNALDKSKFQAYTQTHKRTTELSGIKASDYVYVKDGQLHMLIKKFGDSFASGAVRTSSTMRYTYGYIEMKAKLPQGKGYWPAYWLNAANLGYKMAPEIDIFEVFGTQNEIVSNLHIWSGTDSSAHYSFDGATLGSYIKKEDRMVKIDKSDEIHTYGLEWTKDYLAANVDGKVFWKYELDQQDDYKEWLSQELYLILSQGVAFPDSEETNKATVDATTPALGDYIVDYVHLYQKDGVKGGTFTTHD